MIQASVIGLSCQRTKVAVGGANRAGSHQVVAAEDIAQGDLILTVEGRLSSTPSKYSVQVALDSHIDGDVPKLMERFPGRCLWRFINHSSFPNGIFIGVCLYALYDIKRGDEVTFNYNANEYDLANPFVCWQTGKRIAGFKHLSADEKELLRECVSEHIKPLLDELL